MGINYFAVVLAAGSGQRMNSPIPKQYLPLLGKTVLEHALQPFLSAPLIKKIVVVLATSDQYWHNLPLSKHEKIITTSGGAERLDSCINGLLALKGVADAQDWILEHDAARPCLSTIDLAHLIAQLDNEKIGGLLSSPVSDTIKCDNGEQQVAATIERKHLWHALTPQAFRYGLLQQALTNAQSQGKMVTDSAQALELMGYHPRLIRGAKSNIKITMPEDLALAEFYLQQREIC